MSVAPFDSRLTLSRTAAGTGSMWMNFTYHAPFAGSGMRASRENPCGRSDPPVSPFAPALGLVALPATCWPLLATTLVLHALATQEMKNLLHRRGWI